MMIATQTCIAPGCKLPITSTDTVHSCPLHRRASHTILDSSWADGIRNNILEYLEARREEVRPEFLELHQTHVAREVTPLW